MAECWERRGPFLVGEDVGAIACHRGETVLAGTHSGALFQSRDRGETWREIPFDGKQAELNDYYAAYQCPIVPNGTRPVSQTVTGA